MLAKAGGMGEVGRSRSKNEVARGGMWMQQCQTNADLRSDEGTHSSVLLLSVLGLH